MLEIITNPLVAINQAKQNKSMGLTFVYLAITSILITLSLFIKKTLTGPLQLVGVLVGVFLLVLFSALLLRIFVYILAQRGGYYEALTTITLGAVILSLGMAISELISLIHISNMIVTLIVTLISSIIYVLALILSIAVTIRTAIELFEIGLLTAIISLLAVDIAIFMIVYLFIMKAFMALIVGNLGSSLGGGPTRSIVPTGGIKPPLFG